MKSWMKIGLVFALASLFVLGGLALSKAQEGAQCIPAEKALKITTEKFGERLLAQLNFGGNLGYLWVNHETGTWTMVTIRPEDGAWCLAGSGTDFAPASGI